MSALLALVWFIDILSAVTWQQSIQLPQPMYSSFVGMNEDYSKIYLIGGENDTSTIPYIYEFDGTKFNGKCRI